MSLNTEGTADYVETDGKDRHKKVNIVNQKALKQIKKLKKIQNIWKYLKKSQNISKNSKKNKYISKKLEVLNSK